MRHVPRLYVDDFITDDTFCISDEHAHHIARVMRKRIGDLIHVFNEEMGEYECLITEIQSKSVHIKCRKQIRSISESQNQSAIAFGIIDKNRLKWIVEKATELNVHEIIPLVTQYSDNPSTWNREKMKKIAICSSEQCERLDIPIIHNPMTLSELFKDENLKHYTKFACLERENVTFIGDIPSIAFKNPIFIVGASGGFSPDEMHFLSQKSHYTINIGPNIQRTETACISCLAYSYYEGLKHNSN